MTQLPVSLTRRRFLAGTGITALAPPIPSRAQTADSIVTIATVGEPGPLEPMMFTVDLLKEVNQHIYETLYVTDPNFHISPLLAADLPEVSPDARTYTIRLRTGVRFHDGSVMTANDAAACVRRWLSFSPRGRGVAPYVNKVLCPDATTLVLTLNQPYSPLLPLLAHFSAPAVVMPERVAASTPVKEFVGTGPYKLLEHVPDRYIRLGKFVDYVSPGGEPEGVAGRRTAFIDELRFVPVPNPATRADGLLSGEYEFADALTAEGYSRLKGARDVAVGEFQPATWAQFVMNNKAGPFTDVRLRRSVQAALSSSDMLAAAFGDKSLWLLEGSIFPRGSDYYDPDTPGYNQYDTAKAAATLRQAGYSGQPLRILTTMQYDYMFKMAQVAAANLRDAGFKADVQVLDWAALLQKRRDENGWDALIGTSLIQGDPSLFGMLDPASPGWWDSPDKRAALDRFIAAPDTPRRIAAWKQLQAVFYDEVPAVLIGVFYGLYGISTRLSGFTPFGEPFFWNTRLMTS